MHESTRAYRRATGERAVMGVIAGLVAGGVVGAVMASQHMPTGWWGGVAWAGYAVYAAAVGAVLAAAVGGSRFRAPVAVTACGGVLVGCVGWLLYSLTLVPLVDGRTPTWSAAATAASYPQLVADLLHGGLTGALVVVLLSARARHGGRMSDAPQRKLTRIVIVGGGFGGVSAGRAFERLAVRGAPVDVTLVSDSNYLLFTPMLAEVASGALEARHISAPVRASVAHTRFRHARVEQVDTVARCVHLAEDVDPIPYDHLLLAVGTVPHTFGLPGIEEHAWTLKNLSDATRLRDHVIALLERSEQERDAGERRRILTFVVAGAGFAGTETIAELYDLVYGVIQFYPAIGMEDARFVLVHPGERVLPEFGSELGTYALERLKARGIEFYPGTRVAEATEDSVRLMDGEWIPTMTFVWTAGNRPAPLVADLPIAGGRPLPTDPQMRVAGLDRVWAVGDCARIPDPAADGRHYPPTAQHAIRQGKVVADNIVATIAGRQPKAFEFRTIGVLVALGHRTAAGEVRGFRFSGLTAWFLWRGVYLAKLPGAEKRIRVLFDWLLDLAFPRDIVLTEPSRSAGAVKSRR
ncbi:NAD(P)/FAD-dependent oxidoreductase [Pseudonocardia alaniniphila]|uniref:NADH:ubiquinone reductase (non-electrogenic) n=1 Tax=Pseudonocardia alaniniphila TaxID=75291 RepID=A0ABS9TQU0_9PSEU|nr:NAD(P)/FAD-dependent oxidoreductase [Pseudonocardia alaniniphila]MCH6170912.1 NAD(P)/FAD-dependent oxidoreductase [Pseudonocardia alaniniphila]